jgi:dephospho-CoA kinase
MLTIGLTGSIGMGKSTTAAMFRELGAPVYDADYEMGRLYLKGGEAVAPLEAAFPGVTRDGAVDREALRQRVFGDEAAMARLNAVTHPLLKAKRHTFFEDAAAAGADMVVMDVPLIFETNGQDLYDALVVVSAPPELQRERVLARDGMSAERLDFILKRQTPDAVKRAAADFVVDTGQGLESARDQVRAIIDTLRRPGWSSTRPRGVRTD